MPSNNMHTMFHNKNAIVYGAAGSLGSAVSRGLARAGAMVFVTGRKQDAVNTVAAEIVAAGSKAKPFEVDALDERAVSLKDRQDVPLIEMTLADSARPAARLKASQEILVLSSDSTE